MVIFVLFLSGRWWWWWVGSVIGSGWFLCSGLNWLVLLLRFRIWLVLILMN